MSAATSPAHVLRQLRELMAKRVDIHTVPGFKAGHALAHLERLRVMNEQGAHYSTQVSVAVSRVADAVRSNALRLASVRDIDTLLTFAATLDRGRAA